MYLSHIGKGKGKTFILEQVLKLEGEYSRIAAHFLQPLCWMRWVVYVADLTTRNRASTHCIVPERSGRVRKISVQPGFDHRVVQPLASHYTD